VSEREQGKGRFRDRRDVKGKGREGKNDRRMTSYSRKKTSGRSTCTFGGKGGNWLWIPELEQNVFAPSAPHHVFLAGEEGSDPSSQDTRTILSQAGDHEEEEHHQGASLDDDEPFHEDQEQCARQ
jgi:hypothetical protein